MITLERIAELLMIECEAKRLENSSSVVVFSDVVNDRLSYFASRGITLTPIENVMYSILCQVQVSLSGLYCMYFELGILPHERIDNYEVDFLLSSPYFTDKIIIECDGHDFHEKTKQQASYDKKRERDIVKKGYIVLRYSGSDIYNNFDKIIKELTDYVDSLHKKGVANG